MFKIWWLFIIFQGILFVAGIVGILILAEKSLIEKRSRGRWILPAVALVIVVIVGFSKGVVYYSGTGGLERESVFCGNERKGHINTAADKDRNLKGFGQYITREGAASRFIDIELKDGKLIRSSQKITEAEKKGIEEIFSYYNGKTSGSSLPYEKVAALGEANKFEGEKRTAGSIFHGIMIYGGIPVMLLFSMAIADRNRRKYKNAYNKTRLKDL